MSCNDVASNPSIETPQVTIVTDKKPNKISHMAIILGAAGGTILVLLVISLSVFLYTKKQSSGMTYSDSKQKLQCYILRMYYIY